MSASTFSNVTTTQDLLRAAGYLASPEIATAVLLATQLGRPLLLEGPAGTGKTALAKAVASGLGAEITRLQCHEGIDESRALYEWDYRRQLLALQSGDSVVDDVYSERYLLARPLLQALQATEPTLLLVDEVDRLGIEAEALLLELLAERQVTVPELGTITATEHHPVILTSNGTRELSEALRRRCVYLYVDYPTPERERDIVVATVSGISVDLAEQLTTAVAGIRGLDLRKHPSVSETLDWARALTLSGSHQIDEEALRAALPLLIKSQADTLLAVKELGLN